MRLHDYGPSLNCFKVRLTLAQLGRAYQRVPVPIFAGGTRTAAFLAMNPMAAVPVLEPELGQFLPESNAILCYLAEGTALMPAEPWARAQTLRWMFFEQEYVQTSIAILRYWTLTGKLERQGAGLDERRRRAVSVLDALEARLADQGFLAPGGYGIADISVFAYVHRSGEAGFDLAGWPAVAAWVARVSGTPGFIDDIVPYSSDPLSAGELGAAAPTAG